MASRLGSTAMDDKTHSLLDTGRKDSLSLNVEFVKVNISRSRKGILQGDILSSSTSSKFSTSESQMAAMAAAANVVRFSGKINLEEDKMLGCYFILAFN